MCIRIEIMVLTLMQMRKLIMNINCDRGDDNLRRPSSDDLENVKFVD